MTDLQNRLLHLKSDLADCLTKIDAFNESTQTRIKPLDDAIAAAQKAREDVTQALQQEATQLTTEKIGLMKAVEVTEAWFCEEQGGTTPTTGAKGNVEATDKNQTAARA